MISTADWAWWSIWSRGRSCRANLAYSIDSSKSLDACTSLRISSVDFVCSAFLFANSPLIGKESNSAIALFGSSIVVRVDWTGNAISVWDEIAIGAYLAWSREKSKSTVTNASSSSLRIGGILTADVDAFAWGWAPERSRRAFWANSVIISETS